MARKALHIVANEGVKQALRSLGSPLIQVCAQGRVATGPEGNRLVIERISTEKSSTLPIVASAAAKQALAAVACADGSHEVTLLGRVMQNGAGSVLVLERVNRATHLPISADESTRNQLAELAEKCGGEMHVKASIKDLGGSQVLVLAGEESECGRK